MSGYRYTADDLLDGAPFHYHYSPFEGPALIDAWREDRQARMALLGDAAEPPPATREEAPAAGACVDMMRAAAFGPLPPAAWLDEFIRKFEVFKRLRAAYGPDLKPAAEAWAPLEAYAFLACALARRPQGPGSLRTLNALLKLNDLVGSSPALATAPANARAAALVALRREAELIDALLRDKGLAE